MRSLGKRTLHDALLDSRQYTKSLVDDLSDAQWTVPVLAAINPVLWEVGHVGWFMERWCLRPRGDHLGESRLTDADRLYDSSGVEHAERWRLQLPSRAFTMRYLDDVLDATLDALQRTGESDAELYFFRLTLYHEDMHAESLLQLRQLLGYPAPFGRPVCPATMGEASDDVTLHGGEFEQGASPRAQGFVFDNEKWAHPVAVRAFTIARRPVTQAAFLAFIEDGGYRRDDLWSAAGRAWRELAQADHPAYWHRTDAGWEQRVFDRWEPLRPLVPMAHVTAHEAEAFCRWAGRRLPTEAEWVWALHSSPERLRWGDVWEWTASTFAPWPGFQPHPYRDYSQPWFDGRPVLRGASFMTQPRVRHPDYRNFFPATRNDIAAGFRSCAP